MRQAARTFASVFLAATACTTLWATAARAQITWKPCGSSNEVACGHLTVSLDPSGAIPGTITLAMRRHRSPVGESKDAVVALAGGPGQSAIPFIGQFAQILGPIVSTRDLIAFDQRGTGLSHPLSCAAFEHLRRGLSPSAVAICAGQMGQTRGLYTTAETVADIEAIRQAGGYEKLVLYGTSYGTKVAERYAQEYPNHVEALVLDSVVPPSGRDAFSETTFAAVGRILRQLCSAHACARITPEPVRDLARLVGHLKRSGLRGRVINGDGVAETVRISSNELLGTLLAGDFDPILRAEFPAAARSATLGDTAALARLLARGEGESEGEEESLSEGFDTPLYYSTICEETVFPWKRSVSPRTRLSEAIAVLHSQPASAFAPFGAENAFALSDIPLCAAWPFASAAPEVDEAPLPNVPTLILSGADDLRTPTANAREVAAMIPDARLLVVPNTGHSVLGADPTPCAHNALQALFAGRPMTQCKDRTPSPLMRPTPLAPHDLSAVAPAPGSPGRTGRTLDAAVLTLGDFDRQVLLAILAQHGESLLELPVVRVGGLRAGWGGTVGSALVMHGYSYVPGVTVSGRVFAGSATLRVGGSAAVHGSLHLNPHGMLTGALGGQRVHLTTHTSTELGLSDGQATASLTSRLSDLLSGGRRAASRLAASRASGQRALLRFILGAGS